MRVEIVGTASELRSLHSLEMSLASTRIFVSGAWHEGFNLPPLEAIACGVPVTLTDDGGSGDYARNEYNALVVKPNEPVQPRQAVDKLLTDQKLRAEMIENGLRTAWQFDWNHATQAMSSAILDLIRKD